MRRIKDCMLGALAILGIVVVIITAAAYNLSVWNECRADGHSWWYCERLVSR